MYVTGSTVGIPAAGPSGSPDARNAVFINSLYPQYSPTPVDWHQIDLLPKDIPSETIAVFLGGFLIITNGSNQGTANLTIAFRAPGNTTVIPDSYIGQTLCINPPAGNGVRQLLSAWVPVVGGKIEYAWQRGIMGAEFPSGALTAYPTGPSYAINLNIQAYLAPGGVVGGGSSELSQSQIQSVFDALIGKITA